MRDEGFFIVLVILCAFCFSLGAFWAGPAIGRDEILTKEIRILQGEEVIVHAPLVSGGYKVLESKGSSVLIRVD